MSDTQTVWMILWQRAVRSPSVRDPFEISEVVPEVAKTLGVTDMDASRLVGGLLQELARPPAGKQYFAREGDAVVPLAELAAVHEGPGSELDAYPYEL